MGRFTRKARRRSSGRVARRGGRRRSSSGSMGLGSTLMQGLGAAAYGGGRGWLSNKLKPLTEKIPLGTISDEVGLALAAYLTQRYVSNPTVKSVARSAMLIEMAAIGQAVANGEVGSLTASSSSGEGSGGNIF